MNIIIFGILIFFSIITYLVIFDVILSWLMLFGVKWRPLFLAQIIDPMYKFIRSIIPTRIGAFELTPIIVLVLIMVIERLILNIFPEAYSEFQSLIR